ncbi:hypothetical protein D3C76_1615170 [compost metagenome]
MGGREALLPLSPSGMRLGYVRGTLFPLRVRLLLVHPGYLGNMLQALLLYALPGYYVL